MRIGSNTSELDVSGRIREYYLDLFLRHGDSPFGVGWNSQESQDNRIFQLLRSVDLDQPVSILDIGCGWGRALELLNREGVRLKEYFGIDLNEKAIDYARKRFSSSKEASFKCMDIFSEVMSFGKFDYVIASGVYNINLESNTRVWQQKVFNNLQALFQHCNKSMNVNFLTTISDLEMRKPNLYYCDPSKAIEYILRNISSNVTLYHNYGMWDFTLVIEK